MFFTVEFLCGALLLLCFSSERDVQVHVRVEVLLCAFTFFVPRATIIWEGAIYGWCTGCAIYRLCMGVRYLSFVHRSALHDGLCMGCVMNVVCAREGAIYSL